MTTKGRLWLGFGALMALPVLFGSLTVLRLRSVETSVHLQADVARPRTAIAQALTHDVLEYVVDVCSPREEAPSDIPGRLARHLAEYEALAETDWQRELAADFAAAWRELSQQGQALRGAAADRPEVQARFVAQRGRLQALLEEMNREAVERFAERKEGTTRDLRTAYAFALLLSAGGVLVALVPSVAVSRGIVRQEAALRAREGRLRLIVESVPVAILLVDRDGHIVRANGRAEELFGYSGSELTGRPVEELVPERFRAAHPAHLRGYFAAPHTRPVGAGRELFGLRKNGGEFPVEIGLVPVTTEAGPLSLAAIVDITERKQSESLRCEREDAERRAELLRAEVTERRRAEEALRHSEERLRRSQEIAHVGSWDLDIATGRLIWSDEVYRIFGLAPQAFAATYEAFLAAVHPDDRAAVDAAYSGSLRDGRDHYEIEHRIVRPGTGEARVVYEKCDHVRDEQGQVVRSIGIVQDITERKAAEAQLRDRVARQALLLEVTGALVAADQDEAALARVIFEKVRAHLQADVCVNYRVDEAGQVLRLVAGFGVPPEHQEALRQLALGEAFCGTVAATGAALMADRERVHTDPRGIFVRQLGAQCYACHPLLSRDGRVLGTLSLGSRTRDRFTESDIEFLQTLAHFVALAWERRSAEAARRQSEARLRFSLRAASAGAWDWDIASGAIVWSPETYELHGRPPGGGPLDYADWKACVHPLDLPRVKHLVREALGKREAEFRAEYRVPAAGRPDRWLLSIGRTERAADGTPLRMSGINIDITDRKLMEEQLLRAHRDLEARVAERTTELREANDRLREEVAERCRAEQSVRESQHLLDSIINHAPAAIYVMDREGRYLLGNRWMREMFPPGQEDTPPPGHRALRERALASRHAIEFEETVPRPEGPRTYLTLLFPLHASSGEMYALCGISTDISERKRSEAALRASELRFREQFLSIPLPTYCWMRNGDDFVLTDYNRAAEEATRGRVKDFLWAPLTRMYADCPDIIAQFQECWEARGVRRYEMDYRFRSSGQVRRLVVTYVYVSPDTVMVHTEDITERKRADDALRQAHAELEQRVAELVTLNDALQRETRERK